MGQDKSGFSPELLLKLLQSLVLAKATDRDIQRLCVGLAAREGMEASKQWAARLVRAAFADFQYEPYNTHVVLDQTTRPMVLHLHTIGHAPKSPLKPQTTEAEICRSGHLGNIVALELHTASHEYDLVVRLENINMKGRGEWIWDLWDKGICAIIAQGTASSAQDLRDSIRQYLAE